MIFVALIAGLLYVGFSNRSVVHPGVTQILLTDKLETLDCREGAGPDSSLDAPGPKRSTGFSIAGTYNCRRPMFRPDERDPYIDLVLTAESSRAKRVVQSLSRRLSDGETVGLRIEGVDDPGLKENIAAIYRTELTAVLGAGHVRRGEEASVASPVLVIRVRRVDVPELVSTAGLESRDKRGEASWLDI